MPTDRFLRLPEQKRRLIKEAAVREFARAPFEKVSINQIIQNAGISRGSFYTYFEDKQDVVEFLFHEFSSGMQRLWEEQLKANGGDYFALLIYMFDYLVKIFQENSQLLTAAKNIFSQLENFQALGIMEANGGRREEQENWMYDRLDLSRLKVSGRDEFRALMRLGGMALMLSLKRYYEFPEDWENTREMFLKSLELLKHRAVSP